MDDIPYDKWSEYIVGLLKSRGVSDGLVCELGCGTGEITMRLKKAGYDMIGLDFSEDMLMAARDKMSDKDAGNILYTHQDMRSFELYGTVRAFVCVCDSMNYILREEELLEVFKRVNNYLDKDGVFLFDLKTAYFFRNSYGNRTFSQEREEGVLLWENHYDAERRLNEYDLTIDLFDPEENVYDEIKEHHVQRAYEPETVKRLLEQAGLEFIAAYDAFTHVPPKEDSERIYMIAKEGFQTGKKYI